MILRCLLACRWTAREMLTMGRDPSRRRTPAVTRPVSSVAQAQMQRDRRLDRRFCAASIHYRSAMRPRGALCCGATWAALAPGDRASVLLASDDTSSWHCVLRGAYPVSLHDAATAMAFTIIHTASSATRCGCCICPCCMAHARCAL
jgi:hypothetical protein